MGKPSERRRLKAKSRSIRNKRAILGKRLTKRKKASNKRKGIVDDNVDSILESPHIKPEGRMIVLKSNQPV